jgi:mRNA-degrading endonuclease RelE of RelBE toxin-antitoxin system
MSGSGEYSVVATEKFERDVRKLRKSHYAKDQRGEKEFEARVKEIVGGLTENPRPPGSRLEPWPTGSSVQGWELRKLRFVMPRLRGAAREGRLIYLVSDAEKKVALLWLYTHEEFSGAAAGGGAAELRSGHYPETILNGHVSSATRCVRIGSGPRRSTRELGAVATWW